MNLPGDEDIDVGVFTQAFNSTTNSYKYLFFISFLKQISSIQDDNFTISFRALAIDMAYYGWQILDQFHLSFGKQDKISEITRSIVGKTCEAKVTRELFEKNLLDSHVKELMRYVPYRFIRPFFGELTGLKDYEVNDEVVRYSNEQFEVRKPLYRIVEEESSSYIVAHRDWFKYVVKNFVIVDGWVKWHWARYLQSRNPNAPSIINKIAFPILRENLANQRTYWDIVLGQEKLKCIYSGAVLDIADYQLDHFIPWTYVCHNQLWNLMPVSSHANLSKSNNLPSKQYINEFISTQYLGLVVSQAHLKRSDWKKYTNPFVADLRLTQFSEKNVDQNELSNAYTQTIESMLLMAERNGFKAGWVYGGT